MLYPLVSSNKVIVSSKKAYEIFSEINAVDFSDKLFGMNPHNLIVYLEQTEPLILQFRNHKSFSGRTARSGSTSVTARFIEREELTMINLKIRTNPSYQAMYALSCLMMIVYFFYSHLPATILFPVLLLITSILDLFSKYDLLTRVERLLVGSEPR